MTEKPLHVKVAEALGWTWKLANPPGTCRWLCPPGPQFAVAGNQVFRSDYRDATFDAPICNDAYRYIPRYDTDWRATGPLIEKYVDGLTFTLGYANSAAISSISCMWRTSNRGAKALDRLAPEWDDHYQAVAFGGRLGRDIGWHQVRGETPLLAVCVLILALKADGKL